LVGVPIRVFVEEVVVAEAEDEEAVIVILRAIASVAIIVVIEAIINVVLSVIILACSLLGLFGLVCFFCFAEGVLTGFTLRRVNKLCWAATCVG
jgi:hypothetical protein